MIIYLDGSFVDLAEEPGIPPLVEGVTLGIGVFETIRIECGYPFLFAAHYARLGLSARTLEIPFELSREELQDIAETVIDANDVIEGRLRITLLSGTPHHHQDAGPSRPVLMVTAVEEPLRPYGRPGEGAPFRVGLVPHPVNERSPLLGLKTTNYAENVHLRRLARNSGYHECLRQGTREAGVVTAAMANVLAIDERGVLIAPGPEDGALCGFMRNLVIETMKNRRGTVEERPITLEEIPTLRSMFITTMVRGIQPVDEVGEHVLGSQECEILRVLTEDFARMRVGWLLEQSRG